MLRGKVASFLASLLDLLFFSGRTRVRIADFQSFLCGTEEKPGLLHRLDLCYEKKSYCEESLRKYVHFLGFARLDCEAGAFNDDHESEANRKDRHERFLPKYFDLFSKGISTFTYNGATLDVDTRLDDEEGNDLMECRATPLEVEDLDGNVFAIDIGGDLPEGDADIPLLVSHDEACFATGEYENKVSFHFCFLL